jgi:hypothetical protein
VIVIAVRALHNPSLRPAGPPDKTGGRPAAPAPAQLAFDTDDMLKSGIRSAGTEARVK